MKDKLADLKTRLTEVADLESACAVLCWDQATFMPPGGAPARARQMATLEKLAHEKFTDPAIGELLDELQSWQSSLDYDSDQAGLLRATRRKYEKAAKVPADFMAQLTEHTSASFETWSKARPANDFNAVKPYLEKTLELSQQLANFFPGYQHIADPLIDFADYAMKAQTLRQIFADLRKELVPLVQAITQAAPANDACLKNNFPIDLQCQFNQDIIRRFGYDFNHGRLDKTHHPFTITFSIDDVPITTRYSDQNLSDALFSTLHEAGHGMYEQNINKDFEATPLATGTSSGVHESQSRLWENLVGRSRPFWNFFYPRLQQTFSEQLASVELDDFYRAINKVQPSINRVSADEVTYNLHVMIRFDLELALLDGSLDIADLPDAWRERYQQDLGVEPPDYKDGVLQDVHWFHGTIGGAFQGYTLGNILAAQFFATATSAHPEINDEISRGEFSTLFSWLKENIYQHGSKFTADELVPRVTGRPLSIEPYVSYLRGKFGQLYKID